MPLHGCTYRSLCDELAATPPGVVTPTTGDVSLSSRVIDEGAPIGRRPRGGYRGILTPGILADLQASARSGEALQTVAPIPDPVSSSRSGLPVLLLVGVGAVLVSLS